MTALISLLWNLINLYSFIILVYVIMSWIPRTNETYAKVYAVLGAICDPYLDLFRRFIPPIGGMVDISPIIALLVLEFGGQLIVNLLYFIF